jgi:class 3 adenylate cyclase
MSEMQHSEKRVVLFADICGSTALYDQLGDQRARGLMGACIGTMCEVVSRFGGQVVKTIGDEILCVFPDPEAALLAACAMQNAVSGSCYECDNRMQVQIGFHYGNVILEANDIFGDTVNVASRITKLARAQQIMTSQAVIDELPDTLRRRAHRIITTEFKGKQTEYDIYLVLWNGDDNERTQIDARPLAISTQDNRGELRISYANTALNLNKDRKMILLGRGEGGDIVIPSHFVSRQHAVIEMRSGKFYLTDQSANGSYVRFADGHIVHICRQELILYGTGSISLGRVFDDAETDCLHFSVGWLQEP